MEKKENLSAPGGKASVALVALGVATVAIVIAIIWQMVTG